MLSNVSNTSIRMLPHVPNLRCDFTDKKFNHGGLSCTVLSDTCDTRTQRNLNSNIEQSWFLVSWVSEGAFAHLHQRFTLGLDTFNGPRRREGHLKLGCLQREEGPSRRINLHEFVKVTLEASQFQVFKFQNVGAAVIEQSGIVTDHDTRDVGKRIQVSLHPSDIDDIQMVGRFIQKKDISILKHGSCQRELHTPSSTKGGHSVIRLRFTIIGEPNSSKHITNLGFFEIQTLDSRINGNVLDARQMGLFSLNVGFDKDCPHLTGIREPFNLVVGDGSHQSGLTTIISSEKTVVFPTEKLHLGIVKKNLRTIR
mmetsp:Transcript_30273/g.64934  ORF Transcript_30273/g.64934 Transcript_30273/m.64934 type:complete len:311 (-) Transcript_30273:1318-2250(-)